MGRQASPPLYKGLQPRWSGLDRDGVVAHQRLRLYGAMLEAASREGALHTSVAEIARLAGVSKRTVYDCFGSKEELFLATYDFVLTRTLARIRREVANPGPDGELCGAFRGLLASVEGEPAGARIVLVETLAAGPAALERLERSRRVFEAMTASGLPHGEAMPPLVLKGIVGGVERVLRERVIGGAEQQLPACAPEIAAWARCHEARAARRAAAVGSAGLAHRSVDWQAWLLCEDARTRLLRVTAVLAGREGYLALTPERIAHEARLPDGVVEESFGSVEECFLASLELLMGVEALAVALRASAGERDWRIAIARGIHALLGHIALHPVLGRIAFVEVFALAPETLERRSAIGRRFAEAWLARVPSSQLPSPLAAELAAGALSTLIHHCVAPGARRALPGIAGQAAFMALAVALGAEEAADAVGRAFG
ncbi:MAG: TetR/AcrR family transcriptional regulator [Solirubrobacteraceae bacterium]